jgi:hypothetical protein
MFTRAQNLQRSHLPLCPLARLWWLLRKRYAALIGDAMRPRNAANAGHCAHTRIRQTASCPGQG